MNKINFQNLPNETTPVNANNLNQMQENADNIDTLRDGKTAISSGDDLNNYTTVGTYKAETGAIASSLSNCPISGTAFKLTVERIHSTDAGRLRQTIVPHNTNSDTYVRTCQAGTWGEWKLLLTETVTTNENGTAIRMNDGTMICTKSVPFTNVACTTAFGDWYRTDTCDLGNFPVSFVSGSTPVVNVTITGAYTGTLGTLRNKTNSAIGDIYFFRSSSVASLSFNAEVIAIGRWK